MIVLTIMHGERYSGHLYFIYTLDGILINANTTHTFLIICLSLFLLDSILECLLILGEFMSFRGCLFYLCLAQFLWKNWTGTNISLIEFSYEVTSTKFARDLKKELVVSFVASIFMGFGVLFLLLWVGIFVWKFKVSLHFIQCTSSST